MKKRAGAAAWLFGYFDPAAVENDRLLFLTGPRPVAHAVRERLLRRGRARVDVVLEVGVLEDELVQRAAEVLPLQR